MAQYIDTNKLITHLENKIQDCKISFCGRSNGKSIAYGFILGLQHAISFAKSLSVVDMATKSEFKKLQSQVAYLKKYDEERDIALHAQLIASTRTEVAKEIFTNIDTLTYRYLNNNDYSYGEFLFDIDELKKKYLK